MAVERYTAYDQFAWIYNKHWGEFTERVLPIIETLVLSELPSGVQLLDLCCGTGFLARRLTERGYYVTGVDGSAEMLRYARENASEADFVLADAREFSLPPVYSAATCLFDSLNHIMTLEELSCVFRHVYAALLTGGRFLFDLNVHEGYLQRWNGSFGIVENDHVCVAHKCYSGDERIAQITFTIFRKEEHWERADVTLVQRSYADTAVCEALTAAGFMAIQVYNSEQCPAGTQLPHGRAFFLATKSSGMEDAHGD